jgi:hypothetical protein
MISRAQTNLADRFYRIEPNGRAQSAQTTAFCFTRRFSLMTSQQVKARETDGAAGVER